MSQRSARVLILGAYLLAAGFATSRHEMWRDEIQAWLIARDSATLPDLQQNLKYEGHPGLWHLTLMPLTRASRNPEVMQVWHLAIAVATVILILRFAPLSPIQLLLLPFGYFLVYEYAAISRNYALGLLLLAVACTLYRDRFKRFAWLGLVLCLAAHVSVLTLIIVIAITSGLAVELLLKRREAQAPWLEHRTQIAIGFGLALAGIVTAVVQLVPPADSTYAAGWHLYWSPERLGRVVAALDALWGYGLDWVRVPFVQVPESAQVWLRAMASIGLILWMTYQLRNRPSILWIYLVGTFGLLLFFYVKMLPELNHRGHLFILLLVAVWLERLTRGGDRRPAGAVTDGVVTVVLLASLISGIGPYLDDVRRPFSEGEAAARYVREHALDDLPIVAEPGYAVSTVVGYLGVDSVYYSDSRRWGSFIVWNRGNLPKPSDAEILEDARRLSATADRAGRGALIISNRELDPAVVSVNAAEKLAWFSAALRWDENFSVYRVPGRTAE